jgi:hypothetical protein
MLAIFTLVSYKFNIEKMVDYIKLFMIEIACTLSLRGAIKIAP